MRAPSACGCERVDALEGMPQWNFVSYHALVSTRRSTQRWVLRLIGPARANVGDYATRDRPRCCYAWDW